MLTMPRTLERWLVPLIFLLAPILAPLTLLGVLVLVATDALGGRHADQAGL